MLVKALQMGYYDGVRVKAGTQFFLTNEKHFSQKWMQVISKETLPEPKQEVKPKQEKRRKETSRINDVEVL